MSDKRLPSTGQIREQYARGSFGSYGGSAEDGAYRRVSAQNTFDDWLAAHDAEVARQQAEHDAQIAERMRPQNPESDWTRYAEGEAAAANNAAAAIRARFEKEGN